jgi:hypothetical protein
MSPSRIGRGQGGRASNSRIHLTRWPVTALAEKHRRQDHRLGLPGPRRPQPAGDANVRCSRTLVAYARPEGRSLPTPPVTLPGDRP